VPTDETLTADAAGTARYEVPNGLAPLSVWAAVETASGQFAIAAPDGSEATEIPFPAEGVGRAPGGALNRIRTSWDRTEALVVRPGAGAWRGAASRPASAVAGVAGEQGAEVDLGGVVPVGGAGQAPRELMPGDLVMAVDVDNLDYFVARLAPPGQQP
jgi:hypothetical protein